MSDVGFKMGAPQPPRRASSALLVFLAFPLIGIVAAAIIFINSGGAPSTQPARLPTPAAVTLPPMPTPIDLANTPIVDFALPAITGETVSTRDYAGRVVFLNFWATWCPPCVREMPTFERFVADQPPDGAVVIAVNVDEPREVVEAWLRDNGIDGFPILLDVDAGAAESFGVFQLPVTFVIDATGVIRYPKYGEITYEELAAYTDALNGESPS